MSPRKLTKKPCLNYNQRQYRNNIGVHLVAAPSDLVPTPRPNRWQTTPSPAGLQYPDPELIFNTASAVIRPAKLCELKVESENVGIATAVCICGILRETLLPEASAKAFVSRSATDCSCLPVPQLEVAAHRFRRILRAFRSTSPVSGCL